LRIKIYIYVAILFLQVLCLSASAQSNALVWNWNNRLSLDFRGDTVVSTDFEQHDFERDDGFSVNTATGSGYTDDAGKLQMYGSYGRLFTGNGDTVINGGNLWKQDLLGDFHESTSVNLIIKHSKINVYTVIETNGWIEEDKSIHKSFGYRTVNFDTYPGKVVKRNIPIMSATRYSERSAMSLAAYTHPSGDFTWLVVSDYYKQIHIYKVTADNVVQHATYSSTIETSMIPINTQLSFSNFGNFIAKPYFQYMGYGNGHKGGVMVYAFDKNTGEITGEKLLVDGYKNYSQGCEFSANENYIYTGSTSRTIGDTLSLYQTPNPFIAEGSPIEIFGSDTVVSSSMQLGPDGRIYLLARGVGLKDSFLSYIEFPNREGIASSFVPKGIKLKHQFRYTNMPHFVQDYVTQPYLRADTVCVGDSSTIRFINNYTDSTYMYAEGSRIDVSNKESFKYAFSDSGYHTVQLVCYYPAFVDTMHLAVYVQGITAPSLGADTLLCIGSELSLELDTTDVDSIRWSTGASAPDLLVSQAGEYSVSVSNTNCKAEDTVYVAFISCDVLYDSTCFGSQTKHTLEDESIDSIYWSISEKSQWTTTNKFNHRYLKEGWQKVVLTGFKAGLQKEIRDSVYITAMPQDYLVDSVTLCEPQVIVPKLDATEYNYLWQSGVVDRDIVADQSGLYTLQLEKNECESSDATQVFIENCTCLVYIPNSFSPNGDGLNDIFRLVSDCNVAATHLTIYSRWGEKLYDRYGSDGFYWDGIYKAKDCQTGTYMYSLDYIDMNGKRIFKNGSVYLVR